MKKRRTKQTPLLMHIVFIIYGLCCVLPMMVVISTSLTSVRDLTYNGFSIFPRNVDITAYAYLFENPEEIINGYKITIFITVVGTFLSVIVMSMCAYSLSRTNFLLKKLITYYIYLPTLFGGGLTASYIVNTQYLHLTDSVWVMILPGLVAPFTIFMIRTFFQQLPEGLFDAAKVDGASEWRICFSIAMRLSKPVIATVAFLGAHGRWNEWNSAMLYIRTPEKYPLQYLLQRMMMNIQELLNAMDKVPGLTFDFELPGENLRMALLVVCIGPMMIVFPFFQKYFTKGMVVGSVKG